MRHMLLALAAGLIAMTPVAAVRADTVSFRSADVIALTEKVADHQIATLAGGWMPSRNVFDTNEMRGWVQGAFFIGLTDLADHSDKPIYRDLIVARGEANQWELGKRLYHADDQAIGQAYLWAAAHGSGPEVLKPMQAHYDAVLAAPSAVDLVFTDGDAKCTERWCWCDALFMAPATWFGLSKTTGDARYADFAKVETEATIKFLYDPAEHLFYRDSRFFEKRGEHGEKIFWSRGNGWVFGGLTRMIDALPEGDAYRARLIGIYKDMADKLVAIQRPDGYWSPSLLADPNHAVPESSGTGFYVYGLAWGVRNGTLDRGTYEPAIRKGWTAMVHAVHPDGKVGYVQQIGDQPDAVTFDDTQFYGSGAFLLAGTAVADLKLDGN